MASLADQPLSTQPLSTGSPTPGAVVERLRSTFASGRTRPREWRLRQLRGISRLLHEQEADIAAAMAADLGRDAHEAWFGDLAPTKGEVDYAIRKLKGWMRPRRVPVPLAVRPGRGSFRYEPLGVVLVISPWNYPFFLSLAPLVGALAAGNCVVLKPSEHAPATSATLARLVPRYLDPDTVAVVEGGAETTQQLIDCRMDHVFFTGGGDTGRQVMAAAARHLTPVTLELGGKSPAIVTRHANIEVAAERIVFGKLLNAGQTCVATDYVLVEEEVKGQLLEQLGTSLAAMRAGQPAMQPILNQAQYARLCGYLDRGSGQVVAGGRAADGGVEPTIVVDPDPDSPVMQSEIFGPILPVLGVGSLDEAIAFVNAREKPLAAYIFSDRRDEQQRVFREVPAGGITANHTLMHILAPQLPFGGVGHSGMGAYHGRWGFECFSHRKTTLAVPSRPDPKIIYPPYSERAKKLLRRLA